MFKSKLFTKKGKFKLFCGWKEFTNQPSTPLMINEPVHELAMCMQKDHSTDNAPTIELKQEYFNQYNWVFF